MLEDNRQLRLSSFEWQLPPGGLGGVPSGVDLWWIRSDDPLFDDLSDHDCLSSEETERAHRFRFERDRRSYHVSHWCKRLILSRYLGVAPGELRFTQGQYGKPALVEGSVSSSLPFNLSHSKGFTLVAVGGNVEVGVDVELLQTAERMTSIFNRFASDAEKASIDVVQPRGDLGRWMTAWWVGKEAFIKAVGRGLSLPLDQFSIGFCPEGEWFVKDVTPEFGAASEWSLQVFSIDRTHLGALVARGGLREVRTFRGESLVCKASA
ncbi:MAG: 4'-phosphopantetheinyl transferase sfp [Verrucomicrobia subdivision 3 bacterium]|nr:4'-phosphopantetheinyl transferase sfp [Limisphaerales bacterium]MCS1417339.1 4'-phosphopantetheinyl transferase sfp [Limisphaerales bacterium]